MLISIGCDHAGFPYKDLIKTYLQERGYEVRDQGTHSEASVDYPDFVHPVAADLLQDPQALGIVLCGSGNGVAITANKYAHIRAALCWTEEIARLARQHNNANVLAVPVRFVSPETALAMLRAFLDTPFEGGRHAGRVAKITELFDANLLRNNKK